MAQVITGKAMKTIFYNSVENRLRAGWRILIFCVVFWCLSASIFLIRPFFGDLTKSEFLNEHRILIVLILSISAVLSILFVRRFVDKKALRSLGLALGKKSVKDLLFGFALSGAMVGLFFTTSVLFGFIQFDSFNTEILSGSGLRSWIGVWVSGILAMALIEMVLVGFWEELVFRGYLFHNMKEGLGLILTIVISCLLYGLVHSMNPNATVTSSVIICLFGLLRIYGVLLTNMLWLSMGMHIGWNFFQGPIFGFAVSGHESDTLIRIIIEGPDWLSGGDFGPEGSIMVLPIVVLAMMVMNQWYSYRAVSMHTVVRKGICEPDGQLVPESS